MTHTRPDHDRFEGETTVQRDTLLALVVARGGSSSDDRALPRPSITCWRQRF